MKIENHIEEIKAFIYNTAREHLFDYGLHSYPAGSEIIIFVNSNSDELELGWTVCKYGKITEYTGRNWIEIFRFDACYEECEVDYESGILVYNEDTGETEGDLETLAELEARGIMDICEADEIIEKYNDAVEEIRIYDNMVLDMDKWRTLI